MRFPLGLIESKLSEFGIKGDFHLIEPGKEFRVGKHFNIEPIRITHSIADSVCYSIKTPAGRIFHTGDFKIDRDIVIEVGGEDKGFRQVKDEEKGYVAADDIESAVFRKIPLWAFGFLY